MNGILIVDKPQGWTSHDVVNFIRKRFNIKKVGHAGTLDPMATGLLVLLLGSYTKFSSQLMDGYKEYNAVLKLGSTTDTGDATGKVLETSAVPPLNQSDVQEILERFLGEIEQLPPMVSALTIAGQRLYKLARGGKVIQRKPRKVIINSLQLESFKPPYISMHINCQKGTYIRTLCEDIARQLGSCGHMSYLRRVRSGRFSIEQAVSIEELKKASLEDLKNVIRNP